MRDVGVIKFYINQDQLALLSTSVISCVIRDADNDQEIADAVWNVSVLWGRKYVFTIKFTPDEDENEEFLSNNYIPVYKEGINCSVGPSPS